MLLNAASLRGPWHPPPALHTLWHLASHTTTRSCKESKPRDERRLQRSAPSDKTPQSIRETGSLLYGFFPGLFLLFIFEISTKLHCNNPHFCTTHFLSCNIFTNQVKNQSGYTRCRSSVWHSDWTAVTVGTRLQLLHAIRAASSAEVQVWTI